jgi:hypothetical protein
MDQMAVEVGEQRRVWRSVLRMQVCRVAGHEFLLVKTHNSSNLPIQRQWNLFGDLENETAGRLQR